MVLWITMDLHLRYTLNFSSKLSMSVSVSSLFWHLNCVAGQHNYLAIHAFLKKRYTETSFIYRMSSVLSDSENIYPGVFKLLSLNMVSQFRNVSDRQIISNLFKQRGIKFLKNYENLCSHVPVTHRKMFLKSAFGPRFNPTLSCELSNGS